MRMWGGWIAVACCFGIATAEARDKIQQTGKKAKATAACAAAVAADEPEIVRHWDPKVALDYRFVNVGDLNGIIVWEVAQFFKTKKRTPIADELTRRLVKYRRKDVSLEEGQENLLERVLENFAEYEEIAGNLGSPQDILRVAVRELESHFLPLRTKVGQELVRYFSKHLRFPTLEQLTEKGKFRSVEELDILIGDRDKFVAEALAHEANQTHILNAHNKVITAFLRAMSQRDVPDHTKVQNNTPTFEEIFIALTRAATNKDILVDAAAERFGPADLARLIGGAEARPEAANSPRRDFNVPVLFADGLRQVEEEARLQHPTAFRNYHSEHLFPISRAEAVRDAIREKSGFVVTSVTAGIPTDPAMLAIFRHVAKKFDHPAIVMPTNLVLEGIDRQLLEAPDVHVLTNTIENRYLRLWASFPVMPKNQNPFASTDQRRQFRAGQLSIIAHPQLALRVVPTSSNEIRPTIHIATGSISQPIYPSRHPVQMRTAALAKNYHSNGFWIVQKADRTAGVTREGVSNVWHPRFVEFKVDEIGDGNVRVAATDMGIEYVAVPVGENEYRVEERRQDPKALVLGDVHVYAANHRLLALYRQLARRFPGLRYVIAHDMQDNLSINPHEWRKNPGLIRERFKRGELDLHREIMASIEFVNSWLVAFPDIYVVKPFDNHGVWLNFLLDDPTATTQNVINNEILEELRAARRRGFRDPYEYLMTDRHNFAASLPAAERARFEASTIFCVDPLRFRQLGDDDKFNIGPEKRHLYLNFHGDAGINGARGSIRSHASANEGSISGDSHQLALWGGYLNVGTSTRLKIGYNNKGYSSWTNGVALAYPDGTRQLLVYLGIADNFEPRPGEEPLPPDLFFAGEELSVQPTDNQLLPNAEVIDTHSQWLDVLRGRLRN